MSIFRVTKDKSNPYVMMNKHALDDESITWKAKGILAYLLSLPDDWQIYATELQRHAKDSKDSLATGIEELEKAGYIIKTKIRNERGQITGTNYQVFEVPTVSGLSDIGKTVSGKPDSGKSATTNNNPSKEVLKKIEYIITENDVCGSFLAIYLREYRKCFNRPHMRVSPEKAKYIERALITLMSYDVSLDEFEKKVVEHFINLPKSNNGNILAFLKASFRYFEVDLERTM